MADNYDDVLRQLTGAGLIIDSLRVDTPRPVRCKVEGGGREKRGWYSLHEFTTGTGKTLIAGAYGVWQGNDPSLSKVTVAKTEFTPEQRTANRKRIAESRKAAERARKVEAERAAEQARKTWAKCSDHVDHDYLDKKGVGAHGIRQTAKGALVIPMADANAKIHGLQIIRSAEQAKGRALAKEYWPAGLAKQGHFHLIGLPRDVCLVAEGYATGASLHEATGLPVAVAFDANNLAPVAEGLRRRFKRCRFLICADDDSLYSCHALVDRCDTRFNLDEHPETCPGCGQPHRRSNAGVSAASVAAVAVGGAWIKPTWPDPAARTAAYIKAGRKVTDFNDLHAAASLTTVSTQIAAKLAALGWTAKPAARAAAATGDGADAPLKPLDDLDHMLERFSLVYGHSGVVFDHQEHMLVKLSDMRDACQSRDLHRAWSDHPDRSIVRLQNVGFDPTGRDQLITCNLWAGWPTTPKRGKCDKLLTLLYLMCGSENNATQHALYEWCLNWFAYPIQHPGAKMQSALVIHGPQGFGKNLFVECVMAIYGQYGRLIDQQAIEDQFTDWASKALFLIADEVIARMEIYHVKNRLKVFITGKTIRINSKMVKAYEERNHAQLVFLSNETIPVALEEDDRRHAVIWTPKKMASEFYFDLVAERDNGGIEALHDYLLNRDLGDFGPSTPPPMTAAKQELIDLCRDSPEEWHRQYLDGELGIEAEAGLSEDAYRHYVAWCRKVGDRRIAPLRRFVNSLKRRCNVGAQRSWYLNGSKRQQGSFLVLKGDGPGPGDSVEKWFTDQRWAFNNAVEDYCGRGGDQ